MRTSKPFTRSALTLTIVAVTLTTLIAPRRASSQTESVIHAFQSTEKYDGFTPNANLIADAKGALYGTTATGGQHGWGTVFKLTPPSSGGAWTESILYSFTGLNDGGQPSGGTLLLKGGSLYGTTSEGGVNAVGVVFELSPGKPWVETVLYAFTTSGGGGFSPSSGLTQGSKGTYFGTTFKGGAHRQGVVYRLSPPTGGGAWTEAPIYAFKGGTTDGSEPGNNLIIDSTGSLYGVTLVAPGTAFKLTPSSSGPWTETLLYTFNPDIEGAPDSSLVFDSTGNLYGATTSSGSSAGTVYRLVPPTGGSGWTKNTLYSFQGSPANDGATPTGAIFDNTGDLWGSTQYGGDNANCGVTGCGTIFELTPPSAPGGAWTEQIIYSFLGGTDGEYPDTQILLVGTTFYGTSAAGGGENRAGTAFSFVP